MKERGLLQIAFGVHSPRLGSLINPPSSRIEAGNGGGPRVEKNNIVSQEAEGTAGPHLVSQEPSSQRSPQQPKDLPLGLLPRPLPVSNTNP